LTVEITLSDQGGENQELLLNYFKIAFRSIQRQKGYITINIVGLAIGMACCILIMSWVYDELSYDRYHKNIDNLYLVISVDNYSNNEKKYFSVTPPALGPVLKSEYPEIINTARFRSFGKSLIRYNETIFNEDIVAVADKSIFELLTFDFLQGDSETAFPNPNSIVITKEMRDKYFRDDNAIGKTLQLENDHYFTVSAVIENLPGNTHLKFDFLLPIEVVTTLGGELDNWGNFGYRTYAIIRGKNSHEDIDRKLEGIFRDRLNPETIITAALQPVSKLHLYSGHINMTHNGDIRYVYIFSLIALFVLIIACINFINLTTARAACRAREVGVRKVIGARRKEIIGQFFVETILLSFIALALALIFIEIVLPLFNTLSGKQFTLGKIASTAGIAGVIGIVLLTGLLSGSYPAFILSSFKPAAVLKGSLNEGTRGSFFRKILVVGQFTITIALLICTISAYKQLSYIKNRSLGFNKEYVINIPTPDKLVKKYDVFKQDLLANPAVLAITASSDIISHVRSSFILNDWEGKGSSSPVEINRLSVDEDFYATFDLKLLEGRFFSPEFDDSSAFRVVINETAARAMGLGDPVGKRFDDNGEIIGVVKDYHFSSLRDRIEPLALFCSPGRMHNISVRISSQNIDNTMDYIKNVWAKVVPEFPFEYSFLDEDIDRMYTNDKRISEIFNYFAALTMFISCLGLLGLSSFIIERRKKEIGIRKVFGASIPDILGLISKEFIVLVAIANIIAWPAAFIIISRFLESYAYRIKIGFEAFLMSGAVALFIAAITISFQVVKSSLANPIDALKYE
jgi:ABC-type antimicrobial peptide transport system permease subunit